MSTQQNAISLMFKVSGLLLNRSIIKGCICLVVLSFFSFLLFINSCSSEKKREHKIVATVNDIPIPFEELQREVSVYSKRQPAFKITPASLEYYLKTMIDKKLIIQEAMKKGLAEDKKFVETIKAFWEQTLIRDMIDVKGKEWAERLFVTEDEIQQQYNKIQLMPVVKVAGANTKDLAEEIKQKMLKGETVAGEETIGPLLFEDVKFSVLQNAFDMNIGEARVFSIDGENVVIYVIKKETTTIELKDMYSRLKESLLEQKKQKAMEEWLENVKKTSKIHINTKILSEVSHEQ